MEWKSAKGELLYSHVSLFICEYLQYKLIMYSCFIEYMIKILVKLFSAIV